jgi:hypothetical protein
VPIFHALTGKPGRIPRFGRALLCGHCIRGVLAAYLLSSAMPGGAYFGLALLMALVAAANAVAFRDRSFAAYAVYISARAAAPGRDAGHRRAIPLAGLSSMERPFGLPAAGAGRARHCFPTHAGFIATTALIIAAMALICAWVFIAWRSGDATMRWIALGFVPVVVMAPFPVLRNLGLVPISFLTQHGLTLGAALETPLLFYGLLRHAAKPGRAPQRWHRPSRSRA